ncbi:MAG: SDR family oxidoreductase [bacterium]
MRFQGKGVLVTGASRGLGRALSLELAKSGAKVGLVARHPEALKGVEREIRRAGGEAFAIIGDVGNKGDVYPILGQAAAALGSIDLLVNNASTLGVLPLRELADTDCEDFVRVIEVNLIGPFRFMKAVAGNMWLKEEGSIVNVSSDAAVRAYPKWGAYSVSKAALDHLTRLFAAEFEGNGVSFFSIDPGEMDTRMHAEAMPEADRSLLSRPEEVAKTLKTFLEVSDSVPNGSRIVLSEWKEGLHVVASRDAAP